MNLTKEQGNKSLQNENYAKAIDLYSKAIEIDEECFAYFHNRSLAFFLSEKHLLSLNDAIACINLNPNYVLGYLRKASALLELDQMHVNFINFRKIYLNVQLFSKGSFRGCYSRISCRTRKSIA